MRIQITETAWLAPSGGVHQLVPAGSIFGDKAGDLPLPPEWKTTPPHYAVGLDDQGKNAVFAAQAAVTSRNAGTVPGVRT
jgi:hypothetical protein